MHEALDAVGVPHVINTAGSMFSVFFMPTGTPAGTRITDYSGAQRQSGAAFAAFFHAMLDQGIHLPPSGYEVWFVSAAHDDTAIDRIVNALPRAAVAARAAL